jgi:hypothetical protein
MVGEFPRAPAASAMRRRKRDTGIFFWFVFFHVEENEQSTINICQNSKHLQVPHNNLQV